ncbi:hypothetical protein ABZS92_24140 [Streptomyces sp. NPDC005444]
MANAQYIGTRQNCARALHARLANGARYRSCVTLRAAGARLLSRAQEAGAARTDMDGTDLFALVAALAWLGDQPSLAPRADHLFGFVASALLTDAAITGSGETPRQG